MHTRYFRKKNPECIPNEIEWIEMTGQEFYRFVNSPEGQGRYFIDMETVVLEATKEELRKYKAEQDHSHYLKEQEKGWNILSISAIQDSQGYSGEEAIPDETQDVEAEAFVLMEIKQLRTALRQLDAENYQLIYTLYLANERKTMRQLSQESGIPVMTLQNRKRRILWQLKKSLRFE